MIDMTSPILANTSFIHCNSMCGKLLQNRKVEVLFLREQAKEIILKMCSAKCAQNVFCIRIVKNTVFRYWSQISEPLGWDLEVGIFYKHSERFMCVLKFEILRPRLKPKINLTQILDMFAITAYLLGMISKLTFLWNLSERVLTVSP